MTTRQPAVAGMFYPAEPDELKKMLVSFLKEQPQSMPKSMPKSMLMPKALIVPHAGYVYSGIVAAAGYAMLKDSAYKKAIVLGPSHRLPFEGAAFDSSDSWRTPLGETRIENFRSSTIRKLPQAHAEEHSIEVQLPFLQCVLKAFSLCPISLGQSAIIGDELAGQLNEQTLLVVSSDLSHYLPYKRAVSVDRATISRILAFHEVDYDEACGAEGINILIRVAKKLRWKPCLIDYRNSGDTAGPRGSVVGYCCIAFTGMQHGCSVE